MTPREGGTAAAGHTKLKMYYTYATVGPKRHQGHRGTDGGIERDTRGTGGNKGDPRHQKDRRAHGGCKRHQEDRRDITGGSKQTARP
jgi:hypothetical protein